jgi:RNA polymerase sigma-70 factor (ECF subfamily)
MAAILVRTGPDSAEPSGRETGRHGDPEGIPRGRSSPADRFALLYDLHADRVYGLCLRMTGDRIRALELAQDVFVRIWDRFEQVPDEDAGGWIWRVARNTALNALRADRRLRARLEFVSDLAPLAPTVTPRTPLPVRHIDLAAAIGSLPPKARAVYVLHDVEGYSHEEIASLMGTSTGTVRSQLHRARHLLREELK